MNLKPAEIITPEVVSSESSINRWRETINEHLDNGIRNLLEAGCALIEAKAALGHGNFLSLFKPGKLRIDVRTAQLLMRVANNPTISNAKNFSHLPSSLTSLNALARLDERKLQIAIDQGKITPHLTIVEVNCLVKKYKENVKIKAAISAPEFVPTTPSEFENFDINDSLNRILRCLDVEFQNCPEEHLGQLLRGVVSHLESYSAITETYEK